MQQPRASPDDGPGESGGFKQLKKKLWKRSKNREKIEDK